MNSIANKLDRNNINDSEIMNRVLFVDDEAFILFSLRRFFKQNNIEVDVETDCIKAVELIRKNKYKVIISDFRMPSMNGAEFLEIVKEVSPESIRLVLSAQINQESLQEIVNKSEIFRLITKPWNDKDLLHIVQDSILKYDRDIKLKNNLQNLEFSFENIKQVPTVQIANDDFFDKILPAFNIDNIDPKKHCETLRAEQHSHLNYIINLTSNKIGNHCKRVSQLAAYMGKIAKLPPESQKNLYFAGMYHDIGKLFELVAGADHSELGANLLANFSEFKDASQIVRFHHKRLDEDGSGNIPIESKILALIDYFDKEINKEYDSTLDEKPDTLATILGRMELEKNKRFDSDLFDLFKESILKDFKLEMFFNESKIHLTDISEGMMLSRPLFNIEGKMLLNSEYLITKEVIARIYKHHKITEIKNPIFVYTKTPEKIFNFEESIGKKIKI